MTTTWQQMTGATQLANVPEYRLRGIASAWKRRTRVSSVWLTLLTALITSACSGASSGSPLPTSPTSPVMPDFLSFSEKGTGFTTTDLHDVDEQIVRLGRNGELVWVADGVRLPGYVVRNALTIEGKICSQGCSFVVRFGSLNGERRAYLTVDYGHDNPGTLVDVAVTDGTLMVTQTNVFPPGSPTLSGVVTEMTNAGPVAVANANVFRGEETGWRTATTDAAGFFEIRGAIDGPERVVVRKDGYVEESPTITIKGDTRIEVQLRRR